VVQKLGQILIGKKILWQLALFHDVSLHIALYVANNSWEYAMAEKPWQIKG